MKIALLPICLALLLTLAAPAYAQDDSATPHDRTATPLGARFEIVQSHLAARWTFRLDRYMGHVSQLVAGAEDGDFSWESMAVLGLPKLPAEKRIRYQIFTSGMAARYTFLINIDTGQTWVLLTDSKAKSGPTHFWAPFID